MTVACAAASRARDEPVEGTASRIDRWLLVEAPGPWGPRALPQAASIDDAVLLDLQQRAKAAHARTLVIRRPGWNKLSGELRRVFAADSRPSSEMLVTRLVSDVELAGLELPFTEPSGWQPVDALVAVCTHGRHDACCAVHGRAVAASLARTHCEMTWEVSHLGGDRFAANALVLPWGHYLGRLPAEGAPELLDRLLAGRRPDPCYRGRSCWAPPVQAALSMVAPGLGAERLDDLVPRRLDRLGPGAWRVTLDHAGAEVVVDVEQQQGPETACLTCRADHEVPVPHWRLVRVA